MVQRTASVSSSLFTTLRQAIMTGQMTPGTRLASIRQYAQRQGVSPSTVVDVYERLVAQGLVRAQRGAGFFVLAARSPETSPPGESVIQTREIDPLWVSRQALDAPEDALKPGCGWLPNDWLPTDAVARQLRAVSRRHVAPLASYGSARGAPALRGFLQARMAPEVPYLDGQQILLTDSGTQALDMLCRLMLRPGDKVLVDDPCYFNFRALLQVHAATVVGVPMTPDGPDPQAFAVLAACHQPRLYITNSGVHNPTGAVLHHKNAFQVLQAALRHQITIIEDDIFNDFCTTPGASYAQLDGLHHVLRIGSFSKTLSASLRCGYIVGSAAWIEAAINLQTATQFGGANPLMGEALGTWLTQGGYRKHLEALRIRLQRARSGVLKRLHALGITPWCVPEAGFYLWCRLPPGLDAARLAQRALSQQIILAPGNVFSICQSAAEYMRFNIAHLRDERVWQGLAMAIREEQAAAGQAAEKTR